MVMAVKSAERVLQIFELLEGAPGGMTNKDISQSLGFAPSSTLGILQTMLEYGYLMIDEGKRYSLGGKLVRLGDIAASRFDIGKMASPHLKHLMNALEETCFLAVLSGDEIVYIAKEWCEQTINTNCSHHPAGAVINRDCRAPQPFFNLLVIYGISLHSELL